MESHTNDNLNQYKKDYTFGRGNGIQYDNNINPHSRDNNLNVASGQAGHGVRGRGRGRGECGGRNHTQREIVKGTISSTFNNIITMTLSSTISSQSSVTTTDTMDTSDHSVSDNKEVNDDK